MGSFKKRFWGSTAPKQLVDTILITIFYQKGSDVSTKKVLSVGGGSWLGHIEFDG